VTTLAGTTLVGSLDGVGTNAKFKLPNSVTVSPDGSLLYIADTSNFLIRTIIVSTGKYLSYFAYFSLGLVNQMN
jgi:sugar lactone lactonase YvrE